MFSIEVKIRADFSNFVCFRLLTFQLCQINSLLVWILITLIFDYFDFKDFCTFSKKWPWPTGQLVITVIANGPVIANGIVKKGLVQNSITLIWFLDDLISSFLFPHDIFQLIDIHVVIWREGYSQINQLVIDKTFTFIPFVSNWISWIEKISVGCRIFTIRCGLFLRCGGKRWGWFYLQVCSRYVSIRLVRFFCLFESRHHIANEHVELVSRILSFESCVVSIVKYEVDYLSLLVSLAVRPVLVPVAPNVPAVHNNVDIQLLSKQVELSRAAPYFILPMMIQVCL